MITTTDLTKYYGPNAVVDGVNLQVSAGDRFGVMKFGSRMDVFLPPTANICVKVGDHVRGGETVIARLPAVGSRIRVTEKPAVTTEGTKKTKPTL